MKSWPPFLKKTAKVMEKIYEYIKGAGKSGKFLQIWIYIVVMNKLS